ncbi:MAG: hypothetical protein IJ422_03635 [Oscillospiraceae bacterium]|nr:hypothetical protein [Oscillospiraceae bacterium]
MNHCSQSRIVTLKDLWQIFLQRILIIALASIIVAVSCLVVTWHSYTPEYASTATLYILRDNGSSASSAADAYNEFIYSTKVANDCTYLLKSRTVVEQVIQELSLNMTFEELSGRISTNNPTNTRILEVTVKTGSADLSKQIADRVCQLGQAKIAEAMGFNQVNFFEAGTLEKSASNSANYTTPLIIGAAVGAMVYILFVLAYLLDDRIRSDEDIERCLGLSILGQIITAEDVQKHRYSYGYGCHSSSKKDNPSPKETRS